MLAVLIVRRPDADLQHGTSSGAAAYGASGVPLFLDGLIRRSSVREPARTCWRWLLVIGSWQASTRSSSRTAGTSYSLSRAGYFPKWLSKTHGTRKTPHVALLVAARSSGTGRWHRVHPPTKALGPQRRCRSAEHGGVRGSHLLHHADDVVRHAPQEPAEHRATVPEPVGDRGSRHRRRPRRDRARLALPEREPTVPACTASPSTSSSGVLYFAIAGRHRLGALAGGRVRPHVGRTRRARTGGIRDLEGGAGVDPEQVAPET